MKQFWQEAIWLPALRKAFAAVPERIRKHTLIDQMAGRILDERFFADLLYRTRVLLYPGFFANLLYAAMQLALGIFCRSIWSGALAVYYALLAVMRVYLLRSMREAGSTALEWRQYRLCGIILLCMTPVFASILILVVHKNSGARYPGILICVMTVYAVCAVITSVSNMVKFQKYKRPAMSAAKIISLIAALMSVLSLITALVQHFGGAGNSDFCQAMIGTTSGGVCVIVLAIGVYMVVHASKQAGSG